MLRMRSENYALTMNMMMMIMMNMMVVFITIIVFIIMFLIMFIIRTVVLFFFMYVSSVPLDPTGNAEDALSWLS